MYFTKMKKYLCSYTMTTFYIIHFIQLINFKFPKVVIVTIISFFFNCLLNNQEIIRNGIKLFIILIENVVKNTLLVVSNRSLANHSEIFIVQCFIDLEIEANSRPFLKKEEGSILEAGKTR